MDPEITIFFQSSSPAGITEAEVQAELSPLYDRKPLPDDQVEIEMAWEVQRKQKPWLFDAPKFRLHSIVLEGRLLVFRLGLTCYKDFVGTNLAERAGHLQERGREDFGNSQAYLAEPVGVGALLHTDDDKFVFLRRSLQVGEVPGKVDVPGGHPEPQMATGGAVQDPLRHEYLPGKCVVEELFSSVLREIEDEVNVRPNLMSSPVLLGIARNETTAGRCSAEFYVRCGLTAEQVRDFYVIGGAEAHESTDIIFVDRNDVLTIKESNEFWKELCPSAKGAIKLYTGVMGPCQ